MAAVLRKLTSPVTHLRNCSRLSKSLPNLQQARSNVCFNSGAMLPEPEKTNFAVLRSILAVLPGLYIGATISKEGAAFLEENDIFVPDEDDDDG